jgi:hypothetical protein
VETLSDLDKDAIGELQRLFPLIKGTMIRLGNVIAFEHGAHEVDGGGCGIYHAHLHILPTSENIDLFSFFMHQHAFYSSIENALQDAKGYKEYLMAINSDGRMGLADLSNTSELYGSQYFRRRIRDFLKLDVPWNWKEYKHQEQSLLEVIKNPLLPPSIINA